MSFTRSALRSSFLRPFLVGPRTQQLSRPTQRFASGDYGSGEGNPAGENPQDQGANPSEHLEHPGPPPPKVGKGTGAGPTKGSSDGTNQSDATQSGGEKKNDASSSGNSSGKKSSSGAQPKILSESPPSEGEQSEEVKEHNRDMDNRAEQSDTKIDKDEDPSKDNVSKDFW